MSFQDVLDTDEVGNDSSDEMETLTCYDQMSSQRSSCWSSAGVMSKKLAKLCSFNEKKFQKMDKEFTWQYHKQGYKMTRGQREATARNALTPVSSNVLPDIFLKIVPPDTIEAWNCLKDMADMNEMSREQMVQLALERDQLYSSFHNQHMEHC